MKDHILTALKCFSSATLLQSSINLLNTLGYHSNRTFPLEPNNYQGLAEYFDTAIRNFDTEKAKVYDWHSIDIVFQLAEEDIKKTHSLFESKQVDNTIIYSYLFFALSLKGDKYTRSDLVKITREINKLTDMPSMILIKYSNYLTLSIIDRRLHKRDSSKDVLEKVTLIKDINISNPHRAHIEILFDLSLEELRRKHNFTNFVELHKAWGKTLDTKELNKAFYQRLFYWYLWAVNRVRFPQIRPNEDLIPDEAHQSESVIRLLTRLLFCWFMKEKQELIPERLFYKDEIKKILKNFKPDDETSSVYYRAILQNLFFATLSVPIDKRKYIRESYQGKNKDYGNQYVYRYQSEFADAEENLKIFKDIPFLNGGLFECLDEPADEEQGKEIRLDGFSTNPKKQAIVPDYLFWGEHRGIDLSKELDKASKSNETVYGIIDILNSYKFTIEENTPLEEEIALDPELLGKVFESLLAYYNPETKANARKQTGSFYTPREIVNYMVDESLIAALEQKLNNAGITENTESRLRNLISYNNSESPFTDKETAILISAIENLKILDPACGSGAFPMGILHKLVWILQKIDTDNKKWFQSIIKRLPDYAQTEMRKKLEGENWDYLRKLGIIQQSIYGIDIQPIAIQIAKLRFFISLLVDQDIKGSAQDNFGLMPLPNLDFKLVCANTLIGAPEQSHQGLTNLFTQDEFFDKFSALTSQYFSAYEPADKKKLSKKIERLISDKVEEKIKHIHSLSTHSDERFSKQIAEKNKAAIEQQKHDARLWESYKNLFKHESVGFFETKYFFPEVKEGFDIVIANPPYVRHEAIKEIKPELKKEFGDFFCGTADIYTYFYHRGLDVLKPQGHLCFIAPNKFMRAGYGKNTRALLTTKATPKIIIDFCDLPIFDATTYPAIILCRRGSESSDSKTIAATFTNAEQLERLEETLLETGFPMPVSALKPDGWNLERLNVLALMNKLRKAGTPLGEYVQGRFYCGIKTGLNEAFVIDEETKNRLIKEDPKSKELIKPWLRGRDIKKWKAEWAGLYLLYIPWHFKLNEYPAVLQHLQTYQEQLENRNESERGRYEWYALQRYAADYYQEFEQPKIVYPDIAQATEFTWDETKSFLGNTAYIFPTSEKWLLGLLNSKLFWWFYLNISSTIRGGFVRFIAQYMEQMPIPFASDKQKSPIVECVNKILANPDSPDVPRLESQINEMVYKLYGLTDDEIAIVEGKG